jgi:hypothetical protein
MVVINIGMPRSGTLWRYNLIKELVIASGGEDALDIRKKFFLKPFIGSQNADMKTLKTKRLLPAFAPSLLGLEYVLNTHARPTPIAQRLIKNGKLKAIYGYRDPRDCILSMLEYSQRNLSDYSAPFLDLKTIADSINFMKIYMRNWEEWTSLKHTLVLRYEDMLTDFEDTVEKIVNYLEINLEPAKIAEIKADFQPRKKPKSGKHIHLETGIAHRSKTQFSPEQLAELNHAYAPYLKAMGYQI